MRIPISKSNCYMFMCLPRILSGDVFPFLLERFIISGFSLIQLKNKKLCPTFTEAIYNTSMKNVSYETLSVYYSKYVSFVKLLSTEDYFTFKKIIGHIYLKSMVICDMKSIDIWEKLLE